MIVDLQDIQIRNGKYFIYAQAIVEYYLEYGKVEFTDVYFTNIDVYDADDDSGEPLENFVLTKDEMNELENTAAKTAVEYF